MLDITKLVPGKDAIAFEFQYSANSLKGIEIATITSVDPQAGILVHWLYGYKSMGEWIKPENVVAVINDQGAPTKIKGWRCNVAQICNPEIWNKYNNAL